MKPLRQLTVVATLPPALEPLRELALNLWWTWDREALDMFRYLNPELWESTYHNPVAMLGQISQEQLEAATNNGAFRARLDVIYKKFKAYQRSKTWFETHHNDDALSTLKIAYFSMEYGITECMPLYSGGLGVLAGDHLKSTSYLGLPCIAIGLLYQHGYFRQTLTTDGWQMADYPTNDFYNMPIYPVLRDDDTPILIDVEYPEGQALAKVWRAQIGRTPLYLLDTNIPENENPELRNITDYLYGGDKRLRIKQEILLGIGGYRALTALNIEPTICHMNEGHAAFLTIERVRQLMEQTKLNFDQTCETTKAGNIFTTHTPVPAGIDWFPPELVNHYFNAYCRELGISSDKFLALGQPNPAQKESEFSPALLALRLSASHNAVSKLHGRVSREMWRDLWPDTPLHEIPINVVTNGIHTRSWVSSDMQALFDRYLGPDWIVELTNQAVWTQISEIPDSELWRAHERRRERLIAFARQRQLRKYPTTLETATPTGIKTLNPAALTIGFARRFATYKRATLLFQDVDRLDKILNHPEHPVQLIFAGKAHPHDYEGKLLIQRIIRIASEPRFYHKIIFIQDYDMCVGRYLVGGVDVWLNNPLPPNEASGTSGMKAAANGVLNLSIADGWWAEANHLGAGWTIDTGPVPEDSKFIDKTHANAIYQILEKEIAPLFYQRNPIDDVPYEWIARMKISMQNLAPIFNTKRMVSEYAEQLYFPAHRRWQKLNESKAKRSVALAQWKLRTREHWTSLRIVEKSGTPEPVRSQTRKLHAGDSTHIQAILHSDVLQPHELAIQIYHGLLDKAGEIHNGSVNPMECKQNLGNGNYLFEGTFTPKQTGLHGYTVRVLPYHEDLQSLHELGLVKWAS